MSINNRKLDTLIKRNEIKRIGELDNCYGCGLELTEYCWRIVLDADRKYYTYICNSSKCIQPAKDKFNKQ